MRRTQWTMSVELTTIYGRYNELIKSKELAVFQYWSSNYESARQTAIRTAKSFAKKENITTDQKLKAGKWETPDTNAHKISYKWEADNNKYILTVTTKDNPLTASTIYYRTHTERIK